MQQQKMPHRLAPTQRLLLASGLLGTAFIGTSSIAFAQPSEPTTTTGTAVQWAKVTKPAITDSAKPTQLTIQAIPAIALKKGTIALKCVPAVPTNGSSVDSVPGVNITTSADDDSDGIVDAGEATFAPALALDDSDSVIAFDLQADPKGAVTTSKLTPAQGTRNYVITQVSPVSGVITAGKAIAIPGTDGKVMTFTLVMPAQPLNASGDKIATLTLPTDEFTIEVQAKDAPTPQEKAPAPSAHSS